MNVVSIAMLLVAMILLLAACHVFTQPSPQPVVKFQGGDDTVSRRTTRRSTRLLSQAMADSVSGSTATVGEVPGQLQLSQMALTCAMCPPHRCTTGSRQALGIRPVVLGQKHLFLSLMADEGVYGFDRMPSLGCADETVR